MRVLVLTMLHPSPSAPQRGAFMPGRLRALAAHAELTVVVPEATFPLARFLGRGAPPAGREEHPGYRLERARFFALPAIGRDRRPAALVKAIGPLAERLNREQAFDVVLGHFLYPDGVAAAALAERLGLPHVLVAHGSDVHQHAAVPARRAQIAVALERASGLITVSRALRRSLLALGLPAEEAVVIPCGYDPERFRPVPRAEARATLRLADQTWLLYVGMLRDIKRVDVILAALAALPEVRLAVVGGGPEAARLAHQARRLRVARRVLFAGPQAHERIPLWMAAADCLVLASEREGMPTVLAEALAMGTPAVATAVGGIPELLEGLLPLVPPGDARALAAALRGVLAEPPAPERLRERAAPLAWPVLGAAEAEVLRRACAGPAPSPPGRGLG